jgi:hypothetical protein
MPAQLALKTSVVLVSPTANFHMVAIARSQSTDRVGGVRMKKICRRRKPKKHFF